MEGTRRRIKDEEGKGGECKGWRYGKVVPVLTN
jgi:hypothetical protein